MIKHITSNWWFLIESLSLLTYPISPHQLGSSTATPAAAPVKRTVSRSMSRAAVRLAPMMLRSDFTLPGWMAGAGHG